MIDKHFNPERLREARIYRNKSLEEVGKDLGVSKQMISKYEQGLSIPEVEKIFYLVQSLKFPKDFFFTTNEFKSSTGNAYFRSLLSVSQREKDRQLMKVENISILRMFLENDIEFPKITLPDLSEIEDIEEKTKKLRLLWGLEDKPITNMVELLEEKGLVITDMSLSDDKIDAFSQRILLSNHNGNLETYYVVVLGNNKKSFFRRQFDSAHELAHLLMHESVDSVDELTNDEYKKMEREADMFAGFFLLPSESFSKDIKQAPTNLEYYKDLKVKWKVSIASMVVRAKQLNIISDDEYLALYKALSQKRWRKEEPFDKLTPQIEPKAFREALDLIFEEDIYDSESFLQSFSRYSGKPLNFDELEKLLGFEEGYFAKFMIKKFQIAKIKKKN